jgi:hypothetical protein
LGGAASIGCTDSTVLKGCISQVSPLPLLKPRSSSCAAFKARAAEEGAPSTTAMSRRPLRVAEATRLKPEAQMKPVFMPSAPG